MIVLGIDPGIANTGYGIVSSVGQRLQALGFGVIETRSDSAVETRLAEIHTDVAELISRFDVDAVAVEELYFGANVVSAMAVGQARGRCPCSPPVSPESRFTPTHPSRSSPRSAAAGAPISVRWPTWPRDCWA